MEMRWIIYIVIIRYEMAFRCKNVQFCRDGWAGIHSPSQCVHEYRQERNSNEEAEEVEKRWKE